MDVKIILLFLIALAASGCVDATTNSDDVGGVTVEKLSIADDTLRPDQQTVIKTIIKNSNEAPTTVNADNITLFNTGQIEVLSKSCTPQEIGSARENLKPAIECQWTIKAPEQSFVKGFESKPLAIKMRLNYSSTLEANQPLKINFQELEDITESSSIKKTVDNGDLKMSLEAESPSSKDSPEPVSVKVNNIGPGKVKEKFTINCDPSSVLPNCPKERSPIQGEAQFTLNTESESTGVRNLFISTSYKYEKNPNLNIEVVNKK